MLKLSDMAQKPLCQAMDTPKLKPRNSKQTEEQLK